MTDKRVSLEARPGITSVKQLQHEQHRQLLADLLSFFETSDPKRPDVRPLRETLEDERFAGYPQPFVRSLVVALTTCGLLYLPPHKLTRSSGYITTRLGRQMRDLLLKSLE